MKMYLRLFVLLLAVAIVGYACEKDSNKTPTEKLTSPKCWQLTNKETKVLIWVPNIKECEKDDCWNFTKDGSISIDRDTSLCNANDSQFASGNWTMNDDETKLTLELEGTSTEYNISDIKDSKIVLTGGSPETKLTFSRKN